MRMAKEDYAPWDVARAGAPRLLAGGCSGRRYRQEGRSRCVRKLIGAIWSEKLIPAQVKPSAANYEPVLDIDQIAALRNLGFSVQLSSRRF